MEKKVEQNIFVRYDEGAKKYSMCKHTFMKLAQDAHAVYKINRLTLVNTKIFEEYLEMFMSLIRSGKRNEFLYIKKMLTF